jgi:hypothetical protein
MHEELCLVASNFVVSIYMYQCHQQYDKPRTWSIIVLLSKSMSNSRAHHTYIIDPLNKSIVEQHSTPRRSNHVWSVFPSL